MAAIGSKVNKLHNSKYKHTHTCLLTHTHARTHVRSLTHTLQTSGLSQGGGSSSSLVSRRSGSMASMSGGNDMVYLEVKSKAQHPLFKLRRQQ